jgi:hypothetical protein
VVAAVVVVTAARRLSQIELSVLYLTTLDRSGCNHLYFAKIAVLPVHLRLCHAAAAAAAAAAAHNVVIVHSLAATISTITARFVTLSNQYGNHLYLPKVQSIVVCNCTLSNGK